jgi:hypothetical protein
LAAPGNVYGTNLFPFVKMRDMSKNSSLHDLLRAAHEYAIPQIDIVKPELVIGMWLAEVNGCGGSSWATRAGSPIELQTTNNR